MERRVRQTVGAMRFRRAGRRGRSYLVEALEARRLLDVGMLSFVSSSIPVEANAGVTLNPVQVRVLDTTGAPDMASTDSVTIALATNPGGAALRGTVTQNVSNGIATFSDLY